MMTWLAYGRRTILGKMMGRLIALAGPLFALPGRLGNLPVLSTGR
jgi:hypothetical protein